MAVNFIKRWKGKKKVDVVKSDAPARVLSTYELLEPILLHLGPADLRNARFVSKTWNEVITRSQILNAQWQVFPMKYTKLMKIMLFGDPGVGKRSLLDKWRNVIMVNWDPTSHPDDPFGKPLTIDREKWMFEVDHWSHRGREHEYIPMFAHHVREIDSYALVYSTTSKASFDSMRAWHNTICSTRETTAPLRWLGDLARPRPPALLVAVIATKCDLQDQRKVSITEGIELASEFGCPFYQTSAVTRYNVDRVFEAMGRTWRDRDIVKVQPAPTGPLQTESEVTRESSRRSSVHKRLSSFHRRLVGSSKE